MQLKFSQKTHSISIKNILFLSAFAIILFIGIILRTLAWLNGFPFFYDEAALILNINEKTTTDLFLPLYESQNCPPLFLILSKFFYLHFGANEIPMRFLTWLFSISSLFLFGFLSFKIFNNRLCILIANTLFAASEFIILYTMFFKHYTSDVFFTVLITTIAFLQKDKNFSKSKILLMSAFAILSMLFSYTSIFIITSVFLTYLLYRINVANKNKIPISNILKNALIFVIPISIFGIVFFSINWIYSLKDPFIQEFWGLLFATMFPTNIIQVKNLFTFLGSSTINIYTEALLFFCSAIILFKLDKFKFGIIFLPFILAMIAGYLNLYPFFAERILMYLIPLFIIAVTETIDTINFKNQTITSTMILICCLLLPNYKKINNYFEHNPNPTMLDIVQDNYKQKYLTEKSVYAKEFINFLKHSDFQKKDFLFCKYANCMLFEIYDTEKLIDTKKICYFPKDFPKVKIGNTIFFCLSEINDDIYSDIKEWLEKYCQIIYEVPSYEYKFIKAKRIK